MFCYYDLHSKNHTLSSKEKAFDFDIISFGSVDFYYISILSYPTHILQQNPCIFSSSKTKIEETKMRRQKFSKWDIF